MHLSRWPNVAPAALHMGSNWSLTNGFHEEAVVTVPDGEPGTLGQLSVGREVQVEALMPNEVLAPSSPS